MAAVQYGKPIPKTRRLMPQCARAERIEGLVGTAVYWRIRALLLAVVSDPCQEPTAFDIRDFHAEILDDAPLPLAVLEAKIGRWIEARKAAPRA